MTSANVTVPNFFANKHFVWRVTSHENLRSQVLVFWVAVMLGVALATLLTHLVENALSDQTNLVRGAAVLGALLLGLGIVWVGRFLILDRGGSSSSRATGLSTLTGSSARSLSDPTARLELAIQVVPIANTCALNGTGADDR